MKWLKPFIVAILLSLPLHADANIGLSLFAYNGAGLRQPIVTCDITTGTCTGIGGGSSLFTTATCNGSADDAAAFTSFNSWAVNTWQASHSGPIGLTWPAGKDCVINGTTVTCGPIAEDECPFIGIKDLIITAYGASFHPNSPISLGGIGEIFLGPYAARIASVSSGATCVTTTTPSDANKFTVGVYLRVGGFDMQGFYGFSGFGQPPNNYYYDYVIATSVNGSTGQVCFDRPLTYTYLSTWPSYDAGSAFGPNQGGPATIFVMDASYDATIEIRGVTMERVGNQAFVTAKKAILRDVTLTGANCVIPTTNISMDWYNVTGSGCIIEFDKLNGTWTVNNSTIYEVDNQSASGDIIFNNVTILNKIQGTPKSFTGTNVTTPASCNPSGICFTVGPLGFGRGNSFSCTNCNIGSFGGAGPSFDGAVLQPGPGVNNVYTMSSGLITMPNGAFISTSADNGSGGIRITFGTAVGFVTGKYVEFAGVCRTGAPDPQSQCAPGTGPDSTINGIRQITAISSTQVDISGTFASAATSGEALVQAPRWAVPGTNFCFAWQANGSTCDDIYQISAVTQDSLNTYIQTTAPGGFPPAVLGATVLIVKVHPSPIFTCSGCTGAAGSTLALFPAGAPLNSYAVCTQTGATGVSESCQPFLWGNAQSLSINVTNAYTGAGSLSYKVTEFGNWPLIITGGSTTNWNPVVDAKTAGNRVVTLAGVTGGQAGDSGLAVPDSSLSWLMGSAFSGGVWSADVSGSCPGVGCPSVTLTFQTNQGIVNPNPP